MIRLDRSKLVETFHARFAQTRSIWDAVDAVALVVEARSVTTAEERAQDAERHLARLRDEIAVAQQAPVRRKHRKKPKGAPRKARQPRERREWSPDACTTSERILEVVARSHGLTVDDVLSGDRHKVPSRARHESMWLHREIGRISDESIAELHRLSDHTTVIAGRRKIQRLVDADPAYGLRLLALVDLGATEARRAA